MIALDFETYYDGEYSLRTMSTWNYIYNEKFDAYLLAATDESGTWVGHPKEFDWSRVTGKTICMHNASFDELVLRRLQELEIIPELDYKQIICTADLTAFLRCRRNLATASWELLGEHMAKDTRDDMKGLTYAQALAMGMEEELLEYGRHDAEACYKIAVKYLHEWPEEEQRLSRINREAGYRGVALESDTVIEAHRNLGQLLADAESTFPWMNGDIPNAKPLSVKLIRQQARKEGITIPASLNKDLPEVQEWQAKYGEEYPWVKAISDYRSINSLYCRVGNMRSNIREDNTIPYNFLYYGGHTGRFSGGNAGETGGKINLQNMPRDSMYGVNIRGFLVPRPGYKFIAADYSQIEPRILFWRVNDTDMLDRIEQLGNIYIAFADKLGRKIERGTNEYQLTKAQVLMLGYHGGHVRFKAQAAQAPYYMELSTQEAQFAVNQYREANPLIVGHWHEHQRWLQYSANHRNDFHGVDLPDGRTLTYFLPRYEMGEITAHHVRGGPRLRVHAGVLTNNEIQAIAFAVLRDAIIRIVDTLPDCHYVFSVHDEIIIEVPEDKAKQRNKEICELMTTIPSWLEGCPLEVESEILDHYK